MTSGRRADGARLHARRPDADHHPAGRAAGLQRRGTARHAGARPLGRAPCTRLRARAARRRGRPGVRRRTASSTSSTRSRSPGRVPTTRPRARSTASRASRWARATSSTRRREVVLIDNIPSPAGNHNGGDLAVRQRTATSTSASATAAATTLGNSGCAGANDAARDRERAARQDPAHHADRRHSRRATRSRAPSSARCNVTGSTTAEHAARRRSPGACATRSGSRSTPTAPATRFYINDVGQGVVGGDRQRAWPAPTTAGTSARATARNGSTTNCGPPPAGMTNPIFDYGHARPAAASITGGAFVPNGVVAGGLRRRVPVRRLRLREDLRCSRPAGTRTIFADQLGASSAVHLAFGPHGATQALVLHELPSAAGAVHRIAYTAPAAPPAPPADGPVDGTTPRPPAGRRGGQRRAAAGHREPGRHAALRRRPVDRAARQRHRREDGTLPPSRLSWTVRAPPRLAQPSLVRPGDRQLERLHRAAAGGSRSDDEQLARGHPHRDRLERRDDDRVAHDPAAARQRHVQDVAARADAAGQRPELHDAAHMAVVGRLEAARQRPRPGRPRVPALVGRARVARTRSARRPRPGPTPRRSAAASQFSRRWRSHTGRSPSAALASKSASAAGPSAANAARVRSR